MLSCYIRRGVVGIIFLIIEIAIGICIFFCGFHRAKIDVHQNMQEHKDEHHHTIEPEPDCIEEHRVTAFVYAKLVCHTFEEADFGGNPGADYSQACDRCTGCIDDEGELFTADTKAVGDGSHCRADDNCVGIIVDEEADAEKCGDKLSGFFARDYFYSQRDQAVKTAADDKDF